MKVEYHKQLIFSSLEEKKNFDYTQNLEKTSPDFIHPI